MKDISYYEQNLLLERDNGVEFGKDPFKTFACFPCACQSPKQDASVFCAANVSNTLTLLTLLGHDVYPSFSLLKGKILTLLIFQFIIN